MGKGMKTNKSYSKRLKRTRNGKLIARKPGFNHLMQSNRAANSLPAKKVRISLLKTKTSRTYTIQLISC